MTARTPGRIICLRATLSKDGIGIGDLRGGRPSALTRGKGHHEREEDELDRHSDTLSHREYSVYERRM